MRLRGEAREVDRLDVGRVLCRVEQRAHLAELLQHDCVYAAHVLGRCAPPLAAAARRGAGHSVAHVLQHEQVPAHGVPQLAQLEVALQ